VMQSQKRQKLEKEKQALIEDTNALIQTAELDLAQSTVIFKKKRYKLMDDKLKTSLLDVITSKCDITKDGHWLWNGTMVDNRPEFKFNGEKYITRRVIASINGGKLNKSIVTYSTCGHSNCVSPSCVESSSRKKMQESMQIAGIPCFERKETAKNNPSNLFTDRQILNILSDQRQDKEIALEYGCSRSTINAIKNRTRHKNIAMPGDIFSLASSGLFAKIVKLTAEEWNRG